MDDLENKNTDINEEELLRQKRVNKRLRGLLIGVNLLLVGLLAYQGYLIIDEYLTNSNEDYITLNGLNVEESKKIYDTYLNKDKDTYITKDIYDYGIYGGYLHLNEARIEPGSFSSFKNVGLYNVFSKSITLSSINKDVDGSILNGGIKLTSLETGDYLLINDYVVQNNINGPFNGIKIRSNLGIEKTIYTLPSNGVRKKITLRSKDNSPCTVISVIDVENVPSSYYDFVLLCDENTFAKYKETIDSQYKIYHASSLLDAYKVDSNYALVIDEKYEQIQNSYYFKNDYSLNELIDNGLLINQDKNDYIRELGGYLLNAGAMVNEYPSSFEIAPFKQDHDNGKLTFLINPSITIDQIINLI